MVAEYCTRQQIHRISCIVQVLKWVHRLRHLWLQPPPINGKQWWLISYMAINEERQCWFIQAAATHVKFTSVIGWCMSWSLPYLMIPSILLEACKWTFTVNSPNLVTKLQFGSTHRKIYGMFLTKVTISPHLYSWQSLHKWFMASEIGTGKKRHECTCIFLANLKQPFTG